MATARPGWSRRAQYGLFFSFLAVIAGIIVGLVLLALSLVAPADISGRCAAWRSTSPGRSPESLHEVIDTAEGVVTGADNYWDAASQNAELKRQNKAMLQRMVEAKAIYPGEPAAEVNACSCASMSGATVATGRIVGSSFNSPRRFAILSVGSSDGVQSGCRCGRPTVLLDASSTPGLSPRVFCSSPTARTSFQHACSRNGIPVIAQGRGDGTIDVRPLEVGRNPFKRGDIIITSGTGGLYPPLVPIARVVKLDDDGAVAHAARRSVDDQLRHRRAAVRAGGRRSEHTRHSSRGTLMVRAALTPPA